MHLSALLGRGRFPRRFLAPLALLVLAAPVAAQEAAAPVAPQAAAGSAVFGRVDGKVITWSEYLHVLEQTPVNTPPLGGGFHVNAAQFALQKLITDSVIEAEAAREGVLPTAADVEALYAMQKTAFLQKTPGHSFEATLALWGTDAEWFRKVLRARIVETNLLARRLQITDDDLKRMYEGKDSRYAWKDYLDIGERAQIRAVIVPPSGPLYERAKTMLASKTDFTEVATALNPPAHRKNGGLQAETVSIKNAPAAWQPKLKTLPAGTVFGPVEWPGLPTEPEQKAWIRIERKLPVFTPTYEQVFPMMKMHIVQQRITDPTLQPLLDELKRRRRDAVVETTDAKYKAMWDAIKDQPLPIHPQEMLRGTGD